MTHPYWLLVFWGEGCFLGGGLFFCWLLVVGCFGWFITVASLTLDSSMTLQTPYVVLLHNAYNLAPVQRTIATSTLLWAVFLAPHHPSAPCGIL